MPDPMAPASKHETEPVLGGPTLGLESAEGVELVAAWYRRKPWAFEVSWQVPPHAEKRSWYVAFVVEYDEAGQVLCRERAAKTLHPGEALRYITEIEIETDERDPTEGDR